MGVYILKRLAGFIPTMILLILMTVTLLRVTPGDAVDSILGDYASLEEKNMLRAKLGLDKGVLDQFLSYLKDLSSGNLGDSLIYQRSVLSLINERFLGTLKLAFFSVSFAFFVGVGAGVLAVFWRGKKRASLIYFLSLIGVAIPNFWLGPLLILIFSLGLNLLPVSGYTEPAHYVLPVLTMGSSLVAIITKMTSESLDMNLRADYTRTARAKGLSFLHTLLTHVLKNSFIPVMTIVSLQFSVLLTGALVTESIFDWPGLGSLVLEALRNRDYPLVQGCVLFFGFCYTLVSLFTDLVYVFLDPRISLVKEKEIF